MGGKRVKLPAPRAKAKPRAASAPSDPLDRVEAHLTHTLALVEAAISRGEASPAVVRESANVARALVSLSAERRARLKQERMRVEYLTLADIVRWVQEADDRDRAMVLRSLTEQADERNILA